jgi:lysophospholipase L1-like esterase
MAMNYLALGDSISIDDYTEVVGGGAARQFARLVGATEVEDWTRDGCTTQGVLEALGQVRGRPDVVTLTAGGNDLLQGFLDVGSPAGGPVGGWLAVAETPAANLERIAAILAAYRCPVILNTVYDPTDGDDSLLPQFGIPPAARAAFNALNDRIGELARERGFLLADLEALFHGHGVASEEPWFVLQIEPNLAGATATARHWYELFAAA